MSKYKLDPHYITLARCIAEDKHVRQSIAETNDKCTTILDEHRDLVVECKNRPKDRPLFGIKWNEVE